jgi:hypothetical protein
VNRRRVRAVLALAVLVSLVHYTDNTVNYDAYPQPTSGPAPARSAVAASWFAFTTFAVAGYVLLRRGRVTAAALCLALYSGSGLIGVGHYTVAGAASMPWWRQADIVADIASGVAVLALAVALIRPRPAWRARRRRAGDRAAPPGIGAGKR